MIMTCENAADLMYNALRCNVNRLSEVSDYYYSYTVGESPLAYEIKGLNYTSGVMTSNGLVDVTGSDDYGSNMICIDGVHYKMPKNSSDYMFYVGKSVSIFYDDDRTVASIAVQAHKNDAVRIERGSFQSLKNSVVTYDDGSGKRRLKLADNAVYILNGEVLLDYGSTGFDSAEYADLYLIDNDGDELYDLAFVNRYKTFVAGSLDGDSKLYSVSGQESVELKESASRRVGIFNSDGKSMNAEDIVSGCTVSVLEKDNFVYFYENNSIFYLNNRHPCSLNMYCICDFCWLLIGEDDEIYGVKVKL